MVFQSHAAKVTGPTDRRTAQDATTDADWAGEKIGCSEAFISLVERGVNAPSVAGLEKFASVLKVESADLFTFPGRKPTGTPLVFCC